MKTHSGDRGSLSHFVSWLHLHSNLKIKVVMINFFSRRAQILAKNESYLARNLAMDASSKRALTLIFVNERRRSKIISNNGEGGNLVSLLLRLQKSNINTN